MTVFDTVPMAALADWRRQINDLYTEIRLMNNPVAAWMHWQKTRSLLFKHHDMSPILAEKRSEFNKIELFSYDPALRFFVTLHP
ncbi:MAG: hypothetical protein V7723_03880 [Sneathiella sp.]|uniref:hypothetical protein n=1 Tax=Sneathiella sp. TaxID=1964365 RepID=UPI003003620F